MATINKEERLKEYKVILSKEGVLNADDILRLNDMLDVDLNLADEIQNTNATLSTENQTLKDTNHKLYLRVTDVNPPEQEQSFQTKEEVAEHFKKLIEKGEL